MTWRSVVGSLIAVLQEESPHYSPEQVLDVLEDRGFKPVEFVMGPELGSKEA